jgi:uncharacterized damage-inducible protein DinB
MKLNETIAGAISIWHMNNTTTVQLLDAVPQKALMLTPRGPRARNIAQVFAHLHNCRIGWIRWHDSDAVKGIRRFAPRSLPSKKELKAALNSSAVMCERFFQRALEGKAPIKSFRKQPLRFMTYLIMHESHHRGQIALALKLASVRIPPEIFWSKWIWGKDE